VLKRLLIAILVLISLVFGGLVVLLDDPEQFRPDIERFAETQLGFPVRFGRLSWAWQPDFALAIAELEVQPDSGDLKTLTSEEIKLKLSLWPMLTSQSLRIQSIQLIGTTIALNETAEREEDVDGGETDVASGDMSWVNDLETVAQDIREGLTQLQVDELSIERSLIIGASASRERIDIEAFNLTTDSSGLKMRSEGGLSRAEEGQTRRFEGQLVLDLLLSDDDPTLLRFSLGADGQVSDSTGARAQPVALDLDSEWRGKTKTLNIKKLHLASMGLTFDVQGTLSPDATLAIAEQPFDVSAKISVNTQPETGALLESLGLEALPFSDLTASLVANQVDGRLQATVANGTIDGIKWSANGTLDQSLQRVTIYAEMTKLDLDALAGEEAPGSDQASTDWDEPLWSDEIFEAPQLSATLSIGEIIYSELPITENSIKIATSAEELTVNFEGRLLGGELKAASVAHKNSSEANPFRWQATRIDLNQLLTPLTPGRFSGEGEYQFKGSTMRQLLGSLKGQSAFELREAEFDMTAIKSALSTLDGLINTQSGAETWPDRAQFDQATGRHEATLGLASGQTFNVDLANIHLSGKGGVNLPEGKANLLLDLKVDETTTPPLPISGPITKVSWPIKCDGDLDDEITELCAPDQDRAKQLAGEILKAKVQDKGRQLLEGLIKGDTKSSIKNLLKW